MSKSGISSFEISSLTTGSRITSWSEFFASLSDNNIENILFLSPIDIIPGVQNLFEILGPGGVKLETLISISKFEVLNLFNPSSFFVIPNAPTDSLLSIFL